MALEVIDFTKVDYIFFFVLSHFHNDNAPTHSHMIATVWDPPCYVVVIYVG